MTKKLFKDFFNCLNLQGEGVTLHIQMQGEEQEREQQLLLRALEDKNFIFNVMEERELRNTWRKETINTGKAAVYVSALWMGISIFVFSSKKKKNTNVSYIMDTVQSLNDVSR